MDAPRQLRRGRTRSYIVALILSICVHEFGHAIVADKLGDPLPRSQGRVDAQPARRTSIRSARCSCRSIAVLRRSGPSARASSAGASRCRSRSSARRHHAQDLDPHRARARRHRRAGDEHAVRAAACRACSCIGWSRIEHDRSSPAPSPTSSRMNIGLCLLQPACRSRRSTAAPSWRASRRAATTTSLDALNRYGFVILLGAAHDPALLAVRCCIVAGAHRRATLGRQLFRGPIAMSDESEPSPRSKRRSTTRSSCPSSKGRSTCLLHLVKKHELEHPRHPDRVHHRSVPADARRDALAQPRRRRRVPADGGDAGAPEVARAGAARSGRGRGARRRGRRRRARSAAGADPAPARVSEVQGRRRQARRSAGDRVATSGRAAPAPRTWPGCTRCRAARRWPRCRSSGSSSRSSACCRAPR